LGEAEKMPKTISMPSLDDIKTAYTGSGPKASANYSKAIDRVTDFVGKATSDSAEKAYADGVSRAAANKLRAKGISEKVTNESWKTDAKTKGGSVIGTRISGAGEKQSRGYGPYQAALQGLSLPDKVPGDPVGNLSRNAGKVVATLYNVKAAKQGVPTVAVP
jgi:hypothetical protein